MSIGLFQTPAPKNEPVLDYRPGSVERHSLVTELGRQASEVVEIPLRIAGETIRTGRTVDVVMPHDHGHKLAVCHLAGPDEIRKAIAAAIAAKAEWSALPWEQRAAVFLRAATLLQGRHRDRINASTMLGQSKTVHQAEIDAACEMIDFFNFNVHFLQRIMQDQPLSGGGAWNRLEYRPLDGFVFAISPFNFTSIAANLPAAPALCGNTVVWKPALTAALSSHYVMELFEEAGLPPGVINFLPGPVPELGDQVMADPHLGGVHFTGSTGVFQSIWRTVGNNIHNYHQYPRLVGETGGKDFVLAHASADPVALTTALLRGAFEYQGQKCSAASRAYIPDTLWSQIRDDLRTGVAGIAMGDVRDFRNFMGALIDDRSFARASTAIAAAKAAVGKGVREVIGGECDASKGWFVRPTIIVADDPKYDTMCTELFAPVLTLHVYPANAFERTLELVDGTSPYALTGAVFANDRSAIARATVALRHAAGNFYINDKPTGAVVGQQPFGGSRASGTNDKAGSPLNLLRWISPRTIKETLDPPRDYRYPYMDEG